MTNSHNLVLAYFAACTRGDAGAIATTLYEDAIVYDTNHRPVRGAAEIGRFYAKVQEQWNGAVWHVDTFVGDETSAASEWTMLVQHKGDAMAIRGSEHYEFRNGKIREIRQYWTYNPECIKVGLRDYPYEEDERFVMPSTNRS